MERALLLARSHPGVTDFNSTRLANYATKKPNKVFMPALALMLAEKRQIFEPPRKNPWIISGHYQDEDPFKSLIKQREEKRNKQPLTVKLKRRRRKVEGEAVEEDEDDDLDDDSPEKRLGKKKCAELKELFAKFDKYDNGWADTVDLPKIFMTYLGYRHPPTEITANAVKMVTTYTAVEVAEFMACFLNFCELEEEDMTIKFIMAHGVDAPPKETLPQGTAWHEGKYAGDVLIGVEEIRALMEAEGEFCFPWVIGEMIGGMDAQVGLDAYIATFRQLRMTGGFTEDERDEIAACFEKFDQDGSGNVDSEELLRVFKYMGFNPSEEVFDTVVKAVDTDGSGEIDQDEFVMAMKMFFEMQRDEFRGVFDRYDTDGSGEMSAEEVFDAVKDLGWFPTEEAVAEAVIVVDKDGTGEIGFDEFVLLMQHLRKTEGFTKGELAEFDEVFAKFDLDGSGEIGTMELSTALRCQGYPIRLDVLQATVAEVDVDGSGEIDITEFLKLFRRFRTKEFTDLEKHFHNYCAKSLRDSAKEAAKERGEDPDEAPDEAEEKKKDVSTKRVSAADLRALRVRKKYLVEIIKAMGWEPEEDVLAEALEMDIVREVNEVDWHQFLGFFKAYRTLELAEYNKRAGFDPREVEEYRATFTKYDKSGDGDLTLKELMPLLVELGQEPKSVAEQKKLEEILCEIDEDGSGEIGFPEFLQLMRRFLDESDAARILKEKDCVKRANFAPEEVALWRDIFIKFDQDGSGSFDQDEGTVLLQAVGVNVNDPRLHDEYKRLFTSVDEDDSGDIDFGEFLLLMRKFVDADFGGIATRMAPKDKQETVEDRKRAQRAERREKKTLKEQQTQGSAPTSPKA
jgi:Ca2+-binding EF-hand superfamily protein